MRKQTARQRADALCAAVLKRLEEKGITDRTPLSDPDAQYAVYHAERDFARFGTETLLRPGLSSHTGADHAVERGLWRRLYRDHAGYRQRGAKVQIPL